MDLKQAKSFIQRYNKQNDKPAKLYEDYSGKNMFGRKTYGVIVKNMPIKSKFRVDNLGMNYIIY